MVDEESLRNIVLHASRVKKQEVSFLFSADRNH